MILSSIEGFESLGDLRMLVSSRIGLVMLLTAEGALEEAEAHAREALARAAKPTSIMPLALAVLARVRLLRGATEEALTAATLAVRKLEEVAFMEWGESHVRLVHAEVLHAAGDHDGACRAIAAARDRILAAAATIQDAEMRRSFLTTVPDNAETLDRARRWIGA